MVAEPGDARAECDAILVSWDSTAKCASFSPKAGRCARPRPGAVIAILSTIHPKTVQELARQVEGLGIQVVDSERCAGGAKPDSGTLLSFVGGDAKRSSA